MRKIKCSLFIEGTARGDVKRESYKKGKVNIPLCGKTFSSFFINFVHSIE